jgi:hypothetical protein
MMLSIVFMQKDFSRSVSAVAYFSELGIGETIINEKFGLYKSN